MMKTLIVVGLLAVTAAIAIPAASASTQTTCQNVPGVATACVTVYVDDQCTDPNAGTCTVNAEGSVA